MAEVKKINVRVQMKRDTSANWTKEDPVLLDGEQIVVDTEAGEVRFKTGDGEKKYSQLPFDDEAVRSLVNTKIDVVAANHIPIPETAIVGQTVVVKTVDEDGKPTEWEPVNLPEGLPNPEELISGWPLVPFYNPESGIPGNWAQEAFIPANVAASAGQSVRWTGDNDEYGNSVWEGYFPVVPPTYPEIGQTIVVSAVDEWGHPTEWEAKDLTEGCVTGEVVRPKDLQNYVPMHYLAQSGILSWQNGSALPSAEGGNWSSVAYGDATMIMIASGTNVAAIKVDGYQWSTTTLPKTANWTDIAYGDGYFVAIASGDSEFAVFSGGEWELVDTYHAANWTSIVWSGKEFIVTQDGSTGYGAMVCSDDVYYDWQYIPTVPPANKVLCVNGKYYVLGVAVLYVGDDIWSDAWTDNSEDGYIAWLPTDVVYGDGLFVGVDGSSNVYYSTDFITWSDPIPVVMADGAVLNIPHIGYCNGQFIALSEDHFYGATATVKEIQNWEFYGELNLGYPSYVYWVKSIGHQIVILRENNNEELSYWYFDGGDSISTGIDIITPPSGGIPVPNTAAVGQVVVVKAVDEGGKPTEWEAIDLPESSDTFVVRCRYNLNPLTVFEFDYWYDDIADAIEQGRNVEVWATSDTDGSVKRFYLEDVGGEYAPQYQFSCTNGEDTLWGLWAYPDNSWEIMQSNLVVNSAGFTQVIIREW